MDTSSLCNGSIRTVVHILYKGGGQCNATLPVAVLVKFEGYKGPSFSENNGVIPTAPVISNSNSTESAETTDTTKT